MASGKTVDGLRFALEFCGYDFDDVMTNRTHKREYADLRSIVWSIYQSELCRTTGQVGRAFGWGHATIYCALKRAKELRKVDPAFNAKYDMIYGYYSQKMASLKE